MEGFGTPAALHCAPVRCSRPAPCAACRVDGTEGDGRDEWPLRRATGRHRPDGKCCRHTERAGTASQFREADSATGSSATVSFVASALSDGGRTAIISSRPHAELALPPPSARCRRSPASSSSAKGSSAASTEATDTTFLGNSHLLHRSCGPSHPLFGSGAGAAGQPPPALVPGYDLGSDWCSDVALHSPRLWNGTGRW